MRRLRGAGPQLEALQLAGLRARQLGYELDRTRVFVRRDSRLHEVLQLRDQRIIAAVILSLSKGVSQDHERFHDRAARFVGSADHRALHHARVLQQRAFHFGPRDVVTGRDDHVVGARLVPEISVVVEQVCVAGEVPAVLHVVALARVGEIPAAGGALHREPPDVARRQRLAVVVEDARDVARHRLARRARPDFVAGCGDEDVQHLRRADPVDDAHAGRVLPDRARRDGQRLAGGDARAQACGSSRGRPAAPSRGTTSAP